MLFRTKTPLTPAVEPEKSGKPTAVTTPSSHDLIVLGKDEATGQDFTFPRSLLGHMHIRGMTGSGKTSLTLIPLLYELLRSYKRRDQVMSDALTIIDLKGDPNLFHHAQLAANANGRVFKFLIVDAVPGIETYHFPPFQILPTGNRNVLAMAETLVQAFGMEHGAIYGGQYYSQQNLGALLRVCRLVADKMENATFEDVAKYLDDPRHRREFKDADQVRMTFSFLTEHVALTAHPDPERNIDLRAAIEEGHVIYVWARTMRQAMTARLVAGLILYSVIAVAQERSTLGKSPRRTTVIIDEFQELVSKSFGDVMAQCRSWMSLILANQSTSQLMNRDLSLADFVFENTSVKQYFSVIGKQDVETLQSLSKDKVRSLGGSSVQGLSTSVSFHDTIVPSLERDETLNVTSTFGRSFVVLNDGSGHHEPVVVQQAHSYPDLSDKPMPLRAMPSEDTPPVAPSGEPRKVDPNRTNSVLSERIAAVLHKKQAEERWSVVGIATPSESKDEQRKT